MKFYAIQVTEYKQAEGESSLGSEQIIYTQVIEDSKFNLGTIINTINIKKRIRNKNESAKIIK